LLFCVSARVGRAAADLGFLVWRLIVMRS
jgi:hypothetical protein